VNRALRRISIAVLVMFVLLLINDNYLQAFEASSLSTKPGNGRAFAAQYQYQRGPIVTADGKTIAESKAVGGVYKYQRYYPDGPVYAPVTGYASLYGAGGIEKAENSLLSGSSSKLAIRNVVDMVTGKQKKGATVQLTIDSRVQTAAYDALKAQGRPGAVVALNPKTGAILAMASYPSYDPNELSVLNGTQLDKNDHALLTDPAQPLLNRAIDATYPPGSTFKIVTSSALLSTGKYTPQTSVYSPNVLKLPQTTHELPNYNHEACGNGSGFAPLITAFAQSCDTTFGDLGMKLGGNALKSMADKFGMNSSSLTVPMPVAQSNYVVPPSAALTADSAIGQYSDTVTPLQDAMFAAAIANGGTLMKPYLVQQAQASDLSVVQQASPSVLSTPDTPQVANEVKQMMVQVVNSPIGTAHQVADNVIPGVQIAAKTGTAQNGINNTGLDDAVFTCFAPAANPTIAVGVVIQGGGFGASAAGPIAVSVLKSYLEHSG
jgi:peptidoglycan glycosyltransferase